VTLDSCLKLRHLNRSCQYCWLFNWRCIFICIFKSVATFLDINTFLGGGSAGVWTQGLMFARKVLYHLSYNSIPKYKYFFKRVKPLCCTMSCGTWLSRSSWSKHLICLEQAAELYEKGRALQERGFSELSMGALIAGCFFDTKRRGTFLLTVSPKTRMGTALLYSWERELESSSQRMEPV
jgi:hypothetical protein